MTKSTHTEHCRRLPALLALLVITLSDGAVGQLLSLPVYQRPVREPWPTYFISFDYGVSTKGLSDLEILAARVSVEGDRVRLGLAGGILMAEPDDDEAALGANFAYGLRDPNFNIILVDVQGGIGTVRREIGSDPASALRQWDFPVGVGVGVAGLTPFNFISNVEPWVAARGHLRNYSFDDDGLGSLWRGGFGLAGGLYLVFPPGVGLQAAFDWLRTRAPLSSRWRSEITWGFGAHLGI